jgi:hypothetical protein
VEFGLPVLAGFGFKSLKRALLAKPLDQGMDGLKSLHTGIKSLFLLC